MSWSEPTFGVPHSAWLSGQDVRIEIVWFRIQVLDPAIHWIRSRSPRVPPRLRCAAILKHFMFIYVIVKCYWTAIERALITYNIIIITPIVQCTNINTNFFTNFGFNSCDGLRRKARDASQSKVHYTVCFVCESQLYSILFPLKFT